MLAMTSFNLKHKPHITYSNTTMGDARPKQKRYALVGTGGRSSFFYSAIATTFKATSRIVALCDTNQTRLNFANEQLESLGHARVLTYKATDFDRMIEESKPDEVIVTTIDRTHNIYIVRALELGCNVVTEKPMTIDAPRCREIFDAVERTGNKVSCAALCYPDYLTRY
jgi:predicted dehydrogenase